METPYKYLSKFEKFNQFKDNSFLGCERPAALRYLKALWLNNKEVLEEFESYGDTPHKFFQNYRQQEQNASWGYGEVEFDKYGWVVSPKMEREEPLSIVIPKTYHTNEIRLAKGKNGDWTYGYHMSITSAGSVNSPCVWGDRFSTRTEALKAGIEYFKVWHLKNESKITKRVLDWADSLYAPIVEPVQLTLF